MIEFRPFPKIARFSRDVIVTEKIDGTNAQVIIEPTSELSPTDDVPDGCAVAVLDGQSYMVAAASRTRLIKPGKDTDNYGFAAWVHDNASELVKLGPGRHFGEWWGQGIQRNYGLNERRFSLFNVSKWSDGYLEMIEGHDNAFPKCCHVVPVLERCDFGIVGRDIQDIMYELKASGSRAAPGYMNPEGIVIFHTAAGTLFKKTFEKDDAGKGLLDSGKEAA